MHFKFWSASSFLCSFQHGNCQFQRAELPVPTCGTNSFAYCYCMTAGAARQRAAHVANHQSSFTPWRDPCPLCPCLFHSAGQERTGDCGIFGGLLQAIIHYIDKERPSCILNYVKNGLFPAEIQRKIHISAGYGNFFAIFAADLIKCSHHDNWT